ncbi:MAG: glycosyltransferase family 4 protein [Acidobacteriales bacterium]|nr:glycosyltransferase family 4 protein [Terriglobales bacterium]
MMDPLRILYIAYSLLPVSDTACGGAEQALLMLESQMHARGHDTTVAACSGSRVCGQLLSTGASPHQQDGFELRDAEHIENIVRFVTEQDRLRSDLIHDHGGSFWRHASKVDVPVLATLHLPRHFYPSGTFEDLAPNLTLNCVSASQARSFSDISRLSGVVRNGVDLERFPFTTEKQNYLLWMGRICPEKGTHVALDVAREAGLPIVVAGQVYPFSYHQNYFRSEVAPRLNAMKGASRLLSKISFQQKQALLRNARAVLIPSLVDETSSLVAMEAMACGTPVVCLRCGALPEVVADQVTGFVVDSAEAMVDAIFNTRAISSHACRERVEQNFTSTRMANEYEQLYRRVIASAEKLRFTEAA